MSIKIMTMIWTHMDASGNQLLLALALADHAHDDGTRIYPSVHSLARKTRQSARNVQYLLRSLEASGWLIRVNASRGGVGRTTQYRINPLWIAAPENFAPFVSSACRPATPQVANDTVHENDEQGRKAFAPEPSEPSLVTTTTTGALSHEPTSVSMEPVVVVPRCLAGKLLTSTMQLLGQCPVRQRQDVLDEVAWTVASGRLRSNSLSLLYALVKTAVQGRFVPNRAHDYRARRNRVVARNPVPPPTDRRVALARLAEIRKKLGSKDEDDPTQS